jgi:hypothetical protein
VRKKLTARLCQSRKSGGGTLANAGIYYPFALLLEESEKHHNEISEVAVVSRLQRASEISPVFVGLTDHTAQATPSSLERASLARLGQMCLSFRGGRVMHEACNHFYIELQPTGGAHA